MMTAAQDDEVRVVIVVLVPMVLRLPDANADNGIIHSARGLIVPLIGDRLRGIELDAQSVT